MTRLLRTLRDVWREIAYEVRLVARGARSLPHPPQKRGPKK